MLFQESTDFKIVTVDLTEEEQSTWHNAQRTPERSVVLEGHRDLWGEYVASAAARLTSLHLFLLWAHELTVACR